MTNKTYPSSVHPTSFGSFGDKMRTCPEGYAYTTAEGWLEAYGEEITDDMAEDYAAETRTAIDRAEAKLQAWRESQDENETGDISAGAQELEAE